MAKKIPPAHAGGIFCAPIRKPQILFVADEVGVPPLCKGRWIFAAGEKTEGLFSCFTICDGGTPHLLRRSPF